MFKMPVFHNNSQPHKRCASVLTSIKAGSMSPEKSIITPRWLQDAVKMYQRVLGAIQS